MGLAGLCPRPFGEGCTAQNAGFASVAPPRRSTPGSPSSCWALEWTFSASCPAQNSRLAYHGVPGQPLGRRTLCALASLPQPELEVRSFRNAARQYPCARPLYFRHGLLKRFPDEEDAVATVAVKDVFGVAEAGVDLRADADVAGRTELVARFRQ